MDGEHVLEIDASPAKPVVARLTVMCESPNTVKIYVAYGNLPERSLEAVEGSIDSKSSRVEGADRTYAPLE